MDHSSLTAITLLGLEIPFHGTILIQKDGLDAVLAGNQGSVSFGEVQLMLRSWLMLTTLISLLCFSCIAYAGNYPSTFDSNGLVSYFHHLGEPQFMSVYEGHRIIVRGTIRDVDYAPAGIRGSWISIDLKHANDKGPYNQLTMWYARKYEPMIRTAPKEIEASCVVRHGIRLPALWDCEPPQ